MVKCLVVLNIVFLFAHLELQHFSKLPPGFRVRHFHLTEDFAQRNPAPLLHIVLALFDAKSRELFVFKMSRVLFFFRLKRLLQKVPAIDLILPHTRLFHPLKIPDLLN